MSTQRDSAHDFAFCLKGFPRRRGYAGIMNARRALFLVSLALLVPGAALCAKTTDRADPPGEAESKAVLDKGMSASEVIKLIGEPASIAPLKTDAGKAEKWTYRQLTDDRVTQEATSVANEAAFIGTGGQGANDLGSRPTLHFTLKHTKTYRVTALLMIDDKLVVARQWTEQRVSYDN